ncbi:transcriptional regulator CtsR [Philodulcilactobacillus myokoensis]|uniref:Transcriptional regulator CtsR n=1 Tax=Philodulcilactobacillus myokoensis TaxID=2929573 RepID=A0A9W6ERX1_9LACO|nr:CtsR family transcriptional regulator [Philodulcilactobacillus myokoensis]GLB46596.1 transcriptional regulator CtsR [Philodulcilactobacillus myokoensis]
MHEKNISDIIEKYLKQILSNDEHIEIRRSEIANHFHVVPSQINYVIKTRFTIPNGYLVESKRGGGGYIKIAKVKLLDNIDILDTLIEAVGNHISNKDGKTIVQTLFNNHLVNRKEANIILSAIDKRSLCIMNNKQLEDQCRSRILISILNHLRFAD